MSVPSLSVCLLASLPLTFFLLSLFLPPLFLSLPSLLAPSCLLPILSLALFLFSAEPHLLQLPWSCAFYNHSHCSPQSEPIYLLCLPQRIREFLSPCPSTIPPPSHTHTSWIDKLTATHIHTPSNRTVVRFCL